jgi:uncharacterized protein YbcI
MEFRVYWVYCADPCIHRYRHRHVRRGSKNNNIIIAKVFVGGTMDFFSNFSNDTPKLVFLTH